MARAAPFLLIDTFSWKHLQNFVSSHQCFIRPRPARHVVIKSWIRLEAQQCPKCAVARVKECPLTTLFVVGVSCHKKQISCARVAYFPFDFQWFSCSLACFPLLTLAAWPGILAILLRRVVDIYAKHIDSSATRGQLYMCECVCVCACLACSAGCLTPSTALSHPRRAKGNISLYDVIEYLSRTQYNLEVFPTLLGTGLPLDCWRLWCMSCMNQAGHVGEKESSGPSTRICKSIFL